MQWAETKRNNRIKYSNWERDSFQPFHEKQPSCNCNCVSLCPVHINYWLHGVTVLFGNCNDKANCLQSEGFRRYVLGEVRRLSQYLNYLAMSEHKAKHYERHQTDGDLSFFLSGWICPSFIKNQSQLQPRGGIPPFPIQCKNSFGLLACLCPVSDSMVFWTLKSLRQ